MSDGYGQNIGSAHGRVDIDVDGAINNLDRLQTAANRSGDSSAKSFDKAGLASKALLGIGGAVLAGAALSVKTAANFEQAISNIGAVANASESQMDALRAKALQIGKDTAFSATEGALALEELIKAGVSVEDALGGAADGAVSLAAAAGTSLPQAATLISTALNQFGLSADQAVHVADLLAGAANASAADATGLGEALSYVGTSANALQIPIEDVTTALAILAQAGIEGSRAGTSLNSALGNLATPTTDGAKALDELNVSAYDAATGQLKDLPTLIDELNTATEGMTDEDKRKVLSRIFDEQGMRAIIPLLDSQSDAATKAGKSWADYYRSVNEPGAAAETAAKRLDNFNGSLEQLKGTIETVEITIGTLLLPSLRGIVDNLTAVGNAFLDLSPSTQKAIASIVAVTGVTAGLAGGAVFAYPHIVKLAQSFSALRTAMQTMVLANPGLLLAAAAIAAVAIAYKTNFGGFADLVHRVGAAFGRFFDDFATNVALFGRTQGKIQGFFNAIGVSLGAMLGFKGERFAALFKHFQRIGKVAAKLGTALKSIQTQFRRLSRIIQREGLGEGLDQLFGPIGQKLLANFGKVIASLPETVGAALRQIRTGFAPLDRAFYDAGRALGFFGGVIEDIFSGDLRGALDKGIKALASVGDLAFDIGKLVVSGTIKLGGALANVAGRLWEWVKGQLFGTHPGGTLGGTASQIATGHGIPGQVANEPINLGDFIVTAGLRLIGGITAAVGRLYDWVKGKLFGTTLTGTESQIATGHGVAPTGDPIQMVIDIAVQLGKLIRQGWTNLKAWVFGQLGLGGLQGSEGAVATGHGQEATTVDAAVALRVRLGQIDWDKATDWVGAANELQKRAGAAINKAIEDNLGSPEAGDDAEVAGEATGTAIITAFRHGVEKGLAADNGGEDGGKDRFGTGNNKFGFGNEDNKGLDHTVRQYLVGLNNSIDREMTAWLGEPSSIPGKIAGKISGFFSGAFDSVKASLFGKDHNVFGQTIHQKGFFESLFGSIGDALTADIDLAGPVKSLIDGAIGVIKSSLDHEWLKKLAGGDFLGAIKSLFGAGGDSNGETVPMPDFTEPFKSGPSQEDQDLFESSMGKDGIPLGGPAVPVEDPTTTVINDRNNQLKPAIATTETLNDDLRKALYERRRLLNAAPTGGGGGVKTAPSGPPHALNIQQAPESNTAKSEPLKAPDTSAVTRAMDAAGQAVVAGATQIIRVTQGLASPVAGAATTAVNGFNLALITGFLRSVQISITGAAAVRAAANPGDMSGPGFTAGQSLGLGIAAGMLSTFAIVGAAAAALVNHGIESARFAGEMRSPSKKAARLIGIPLGMGAVGGVEDTIPHMEKAAASLVAASMGAKKGRSVLGLKTGNRSVPAASGARTGGSNVTFVTYALDAASLASVLEGSDAGKYARETLGHMPTALASARGNR